MKRRVSMNKIKTRIIKVNEKNPEKELILEGARIIKAGGLVAFPTETVYGLGANGLDEKSVKKIFIAKGRPQDNPLMLNVADKSQVIPLVESISLEAEKLMEKFWPGPLTILFKKSNAVPDIITGGLDTVAIRMPNNAIAVKLIEMSGVPLAAPSANTSGKPSPTSANHVMEDLNGKIDMILDGGTTGIGVESTVLDISEDRQVILRPGAISLEDLREILPDVEENIVSKSPGQKYRHYTPNAKMILFDGDLEDIIATINKYALEYLNRGKTVGIMATDETINRYEKGSILSMGSRKDKDSIAHNLFNIIRIFDDNKVDIILTEGVESSGIGSAIMNRLKKASSGNIINV